MRATGFVGAQIVKFAEASPAFTSIITLTRRTPSFESTKIKALENADSFNWSETIKSNPTEAFISAFGTTRAKAGSAEQFKKIDYGINYDSAKAAKESGTKVFVLVSSIGANAKSSLLYLKTKGELEDDIIKLGFDHTVILRPGVLLGEREGAHGLGNDVAQKVGGWLRNTFFQRFLNSVEGSEVAKVAVDFAAKGIKGELTEKVQIVESAEIINLASKL
ncbi:FMP52 Protein FMP52 [Candida maltosa Xu316]